MKLELTSNTTLNNLLSQYDLPVFTLVLPEGACVEVIDDFYSEAKLHFVLERGSCLSYSLKASSMDLQKSLTFSLVDSGARAKIKCVFDGKEDNSCKLETVLHHQASETASDLEIKGALSDRASLLSNNLIRVERGLSKVSAREQNKNLILGDFAHVVTIPKLEVESDDVSCQHGATISRLDDKQLFYLQSRGMSTKSARKLLTEAFLS